MKTEATPSGKGFPHFRSHWLYRRVEDGWEDLGRMSKSSDVREDGKILLHCLACPVCNDILNIGKQDGKVFYYCRRCLVKMVTPSLSSSL